MYYLWPSEVTLVPAILHPPLDFAVCTTDHPTLGACDIISILELVLGNQRVANY